MQTVKQGSQGAAVKFCQERLNRHGFGPLLVDGDFGPATHRAVVQFQQANDLVADGIVGPRTWDKLRVESKAPVPDEVRIEVEWEPAAGVGGLQSEAVYAALTDLGAKESPDGSNNGPEIAHLVQGYAAMWQIPGSKDDAPWCAKACSVWTAMALNLGERGDEVDWSVHPFGKWLGSVAYIEDWAKRRGRFSTDLSIMPVGAIYTMGRGGSSSDPSASLRSGHCGLVIGDLGHRFECVDGNVGNEVQRRVRDKATIRGWVRWW